MSFPRCFFLLFLLIFPVFVSGPAAAAMVFCNRTQGAIEAAIGYREQGDWTSEGWWRIEPGQCARVFGKPLVERFYFYYATALTPPAHDKSPFAWSGKYEFCTDTKAFRIDGDGQCDQRDFQTRGFQEIDIGPNIHDYTLDFRDGSDGR
jgi:uncharacterized membrane protein